MVSLSHVCILLEKFGFVNLHRHRTRWQDTLQNTYVNFATCLFLFHILSHLYSTITRATRYLPEFFQALLEDTIIFALLYWVFYFRLVYRRINKMIDAMESFSTADKTIVARSHYTSKLICVVFVSSVSFCLTGSFLETMLPPTPAELQIRHQVYRTAHPERKLPYPLRIPFIDETQTPNYELLYALDIVIMFYIVFWVSLVVSCVPVISTHVRGQYEILGKYIAKIGHTHRDADGHEIFYTNIEKDEYHVRLNSPSAGAKVKKLVSVKERLKQKQDYEKHYVGQIVRFHAKLVKFQKEWTSILGRLMFALIFANNIMISLCLYQTVVNSTQISALRNFKFVAELIAVNMEYFFICNSSETFDDCHNIMLLAFAESEWGFCSPQTRRDLCIILRRVQRPNHLRFYDGAVVICAPYFLKVLKVAYTFVNYIQLATVHK